MEVGTSTILDRLSEMEKKMIEYEKLNSRVIALEDIIGVTDIRPRNPKEAMRLANIKS